MAITSLDGLIAGMKSPDEFYKIGAGTQVVGRPYTPMYANGMPGVMTAPAGGIQGLGLTSKPTALDFPPAVEGQNIYLARFAGEAINVGTLWLCDRLWENSGNSATSTNAQNHFLTANSITQANPTIITTTAGHGQAAGTFTVHITDSNSTPSIDGTYAATYVSATEFSIPVNVTNAGNSAVVYIAIPPRDKWGTAVPNGASSVYGEDVFLAYEVSGVMGSGTPTFTATYVNSAGVAGRTTPSISFATTMILGAFIPIPLAAGDDGIRAIYSHTKNATQTSGTYHLVMYRVLSRIFVAAAGVGQAVDAITGGFVKAHDNTCPFLVWVPGTTTAPTYLYGQVIWAQG